MIDRQYLCVIGDLVKSRNIRERAAFQEDLEKAIARINQRKHSVSPWTLTLGDEFQSVFASGEGLWDDMLALMLAGWPQRIRFSLAVGRLSTPVNRRQALGMDGPAFYLARKGIDTLKNKGGVIRLSYEKPSETGELLRLFASLTGKIMYQARTNTRLKVFRGLLANRSGKEIAKESGISASAVSQQMETGVLEELVVGARQMEASWRQCLKTG